MSGLQIKELGNKTPLGAADAHNINYLAKNGKTGLMYSVRKGIAPESDIGVMSILGYDPFKYATGRGILEAVGADITMKNGDLALRCNFATLGDGKEIIDRRVGRNITPEESVELSRAINEKVKLESHPTDFEFKNTVGHRAVLVIRSKTNSLSGKISNTDPAYTRIEEIGVAKKKVEMILKKCKPMDKDKRAKTSARLVNEFLEKSHLVLDKHEINMKRTANGKLKANLILTRDAGHILPNFYNLNGKYKLRFACLADMPVERGIAKLSGMALIDLPFPSNNLEKDIRLRVKKLFEVLSSYDCFFIHIKGPDEPGHEGDFKLKTQSIKLIDREFFGRLIQTINLSDYLICVTSDHSTPCILRVHSDDPVPVLISGDKIKGDNILKFSEKECLKGSLGILNKGTELMPILMDFLTKAKN